MTTYPIHVFKCGCQVSDVPHNKARRPYCPKHPDEPLVGVILECVCGCGRVSGVLYKLTWHWCHPECKKARQKLTDRAFHQRKKPPVKRAMKKEAPEENINVFEYFKPLPKPKLEDYPGLVDLARRGILCTDRSK